MPENRANRGPNQIDAKDPTRLILRSTSSEPFPPLLVITPELKQRINYELSLGKQPEDVAISALYSDAFFLADVVGTIQLQRIENGTINDGRIAENIFEDKETIKGFNEAVFKLNQERISSNLSPLEQAEQIIFGRNSALSTQNPSGSEILKEELERCTKMAISEGRDPEKDPFLKGFRAASGRHDALWSFIQETIKRNPILLR